MRRTTLADAGYSELRTIPALPSPLRPRPHDLLEDRYGDLWVGTNGGLDRIGAESGEIEHFLHDPRTTDSLSDNRVRAIFEDGDGTLWVGTLDGLDVLDRTNGETRHFSPGDRSGLSDPRVMSLLTVTTSYPSSSQLSTSPHRTRTVTSTG